MMIPVVEFINAQMEAWPEAADRHRRLSETMTRAVATSRRRIMLQHNPLRAASTGAVVDKASIAARPCFLCRANRPQPQSAIVWGTYEILVNPFPIFERHLTIASRTHRPQAISGRMHEMLALAGELPGFTVFYNGPRCGASAPDHLHFQAVPSDKLPLYDAIACSSAAGRKGIVGVYDLLPAVFVAESDNADTLASAVEEIMELLSLTDGEPMVNILCDHMEDRFRAIVIPRSKHRPDCFGRGEGERLISPASIDMAGVVVTPCACDYETLTADEIEKILNEVSVPSNKLLEILNRWNPI